MQHWGLHNITQAEWPFFTASYAVISRSTDPSASFIPGFTAYRPFWTPWKDQWSLSRLVRCSRLGGFFCFTPNQTDSQSAVLPMELGISGSTNEEAQGADPGPQSFGMDSNLPRISRVQIPDSARCESLPSLNCGRPAA